MAELITGIDYTALTIWFWHRGYISEQIKVPALSCTWLRHERQGSVWREGVSGEGRSFFRDDQLICASLVR